VNRAIYIASFTSPFSIVYKFFANYNLIEPFKIVMEVGRLATALETQHDYQETPNLNSKKKHPKGLYVLFFTELWERYSYYGMRSVLVLYLTAALISGGLGMDKAQALMLYGMYTGFVYFTPMIGGYLTDRFIPLRTAITIGGIIMACGDFSVFAFNSKYGLYLGLILLIIGNGFFKPNISTLVGELYEKNDSRKDAAFTIFYMGINLGALIAPLVAGFLAADLMQTNISGVIHYGYKWAFLASSCGMILGQIIFNTLGPRFLGEAGKTVARKQVTVSNSDKAKPLTKKEKQRTIAILILACFVVAFWAGFEQAGSSFTLYTKNFVDRTIFGYEVPTSWFSSLNPFFILVFAPILSALWVKLSKREKGDMKIPTKMAIGLILLGVGFLVLVLAVMQTGSNDHHIPVKASMLFIVFTYFFHTMGELFLSPVGLSLVSRISPVKIASLLMGVWFLSNAAANYVSGYLAAYTQSLGYLDIFLGIGIIVIILGLILMLISKFIVRLME
jgi:proton-dependent oligopeptide transporter, POT family